MMVSCSDIYSFPTEVKAKMERIRITVEISEDIKKGIEKVIREHYPHMKTVSDVVREALKQLLEKETG